MRKIHSLFPPSLKLQHNVLHLLSPELQKLYQFLEVDFDPLHLCSNVVPILEELETQEHLSQYVQLIKDITLVRLIKQVRTCLGKGSTPDDRVKGRYASLQYLRQVMLS